MPKLKASLDKRELLYSDPANQAKAEQRGWEKAIEAAAEVAHDEEVLEGKPIVDLEYFTREELCRASVLATKACIERKIRSLKYTG